MPGVDIDRLLEPHTPEGKVHEFLKFKKLLETSPDVVDYVALKPLWDTKGRGATYWVALIVDEHKRSEVITAWSFMKKAGPVYEHVAGVSKPRSFLQLSNAINEYASSLTQKLADPKCPYEIVTRVEHHDNLDSLAVAMLHSFSFERVLKNSNVPVPAGPRAPRARRGKTDWW